MCGTPEEFLAAFRRYVDRHGLFVPTATPAPALHRGRFALTLRDGRVLIEGDAEVASSSPLPSALYGRPGMTLHFASLDDASQQVLRALEQAKLSLKGAAAAPELPVRPSRLRAPVEHAESPEPSARGVDPVTALAACVVVGDLDALVPTRVQARARTVPPSAGSRFVIPSIQPAQPARAISSPIRQATAPLFASPGAREAARPELTDGEATEIRPVIEESSAQPSGPTLTSPSISVPPMESSGVRRMSPGGLVEADSEATLGGPPPIPASGAASPSAESSSMIRANGAPRATTTAGLAVPPQRPSQRSLGGPVASRPSDPALRAGADAAVLSAPLPGSIEETSAARRAALQAGPPGAAVEGEPAGVPAGRDSRPLERPSSARLGAPPPPLASAPAPAGRDSRPLERPSSARLGAPPPPLASAPAPAGRDSRPLERPSSARLGAPPPPLASAPAPAGRDSRPLERPSSARLGAPPPPLASAPAPAGRDSRPLERPSSARLGAPPPPLVSAPAPAGRDSRPLERPSSPRLGSAGPAAGLGSRPVESPLANPTTSAGPSPAAPSGEPPPITFRRPERRSYSQIRRSPVGAPVEPAHEDLRTIPVSVDADAAIPEAVHDSIYVEAVPEPTEQPLTRREGRPRMAPRPASSGAALAEGVPPPPPLARRMTQPRLPATSAVGDIAPRPQTEGAPLPSLVRPSTSPEPQGSGELPSPLSTPIRLGHSSQQVPALQGAPDLTMPEPALAPSPRMPTAPSQPTVPIRPPIERSDAAARVETGDDGAPGPDHDDPATGPMSIAEVAGGLAAAPGAVGQGHAPAVDAPDEAAEDEPAREPARGLHFSDTASVSEPLRAVAANRPPTPFLTASDRSGAAPLAEALASPAAAAAAENAANVDGGWDEDDAAGDPAKAPRAAESGSDAPEAPREPARGGKGARVRHDWVEPVIADAKVEIDPALYAHSAINRSFEENFAMPAPASPTDWPAQAAQPAPWAPAAPQPMDAGVSGGYPYAPPPQDAYANPYDSAYPQSYHSGDETALVVAPPVGHRRTLVIIGSAVLAVLLGLAFYLLYARSAEPGARSTRPSGSPEEPSAAPRTSGASSASEHTEPSQAAPHRGNLDESGAVAPRAVDTTESPPRGTATAEQCQARLQSKPSGAEVWQGDRLLGTTPLDATLECGASAFRFRMPGMAEAHRDVTLTSEPIVIEMALEAATIELEIVTKPGGARLWVDKKDIGRSPQTVTVPVGVPLVVSASKDGRAATRKVTPSSGQSRLMLELKRASRSAGKASDSSLPDL
ncbi:MAG: hypothetical protein R3B48_11145 [Kofleriaceae bacterium]